VADAATLVEPARAHTTLPLDDPEPLVAAVARDQAAVADDLDAVAARPEAPGYTVERELARGGVGAVFAARDAEGAFVAVKFLAAPGRPGDPARRRFVREAHVLTRLDHPNVVRVRDVGEGDSPFLVLDYVPGGSLADRLEREGPLPIEEAAHMACQLAHAVHHAHEAAVLHRDVKPDNVLLRDDGEPLLTDFGIAQDLADEGSRLTQVGRALGTPQFWSPEQATGRLERISTRTDVYGVGGTLYAMLTGQAPHEGENLMEIFTAMKEGPAPPSALRPEVDADLEAICLEALARDPAGRPASALALAQRLEAYLDRDASRSTRPTLRCQCPRCGRTFVLPAHYDGRRGRCLGCKCTLRVRRGTGILMVRLGESSAETLSASAAVDPDAPRPLAPAALALGGGGAGVALAGLALALGGVSGGPVALVGLASLALVGGAFWVQARAASPRPPSGGEDEDEAGSAALAASTLPLGSRAPRAVVRPRATPPEGAEPPAPSEEAKPPPGPAIRVRPRRPRPDRRRV